MAKRKSAINPFYVLLVVFGLVFFVTACAYGVMAFRAVSDASHIGFATGTSEPSPAIPATPAESSRLLEFLDKHGMQLLGVELALLALATFAAMGTDSYWASRTRSDLSAEPTAPVDPTVRPDPGSRLP